MADPGPLVFYTDKLPSPIGDMAISVDGAGALRSLDWVETGRADFYSLDRYYPNADRQDRPAPPWLASALTTYFEGRLEVIDDLPIALPGTPFQRAVWAALCEIAVGTTCSYGDIAGQLKKPGAMRAVGMANNANPIAIVVPCHRVIGANGKMVGYGSGVKRKEWLLRHEGALRSQSGGAQQELEF